MENFNPAKLTLEQSEERFKILQYKVLETQIENVWREFEVAGFEPLLIKGWAASRLYPEPFRRHFSDIDLIINPAQYDEAFGFMQRVQGNFPIDLHRGARHLDSVDYADLFANARIVKCGQTDIRVLRPEDHLRVLCVHWLNDGGADRDKLWDIYYAVARRPENFDWERFLNTVSSRRRRWIVCAIGLAHKYLQLKIDDTPISDEARALPAWLPRAVEKEWRSGVRLEPLHYHLRNKNELWKQIKKRIPPNPIQAIIEVEGDFDRNLRIVYQLKSILPRLKPSLKRIGNSLNLKKIIVNKDNYDE